MSMSFLRFLSLLLLICSCVTAFNLVSYTNVQYTDLYNHYKDLSFQSYPFYGHPEQSDWVSLPINSSFTDGFFSGIFWNLFEFNATASLLKMATELMLPTAPVATETYTHDIGFVIMSGFGHAYRLFKVPEYLEVIITAARSLSTRYSPVVRCTRSWNSQEGFLVIIDNMMNLELLFEASNRTNDSTWHDIAWQHANRTMYEHFRLDNSTYHVVEYNEADGSVIRKYTAQGRNDTPLSPLRIHLLPGYADWSTWSRGQAWAVYGFTVAYRYTRYQPFLDKAIGAANYFLSRLSTSNDSIPYWDFDALQNSSIAYQPRDTSAGSIFASGLVELSQLAPEMKDRFLTSAKAIFDQLTSPNYLILNHKDYVLRAVMTNGTQGPYPAKPYDLATVWGDYYLIQTALRLSKIH